MEKGTNKQYPVCYLYSQFTLKRDLRAALNKLIEGIKDEEIDQLLKECKVEGQANGDRKHAKLVDVIMSKWSL